MTTGFIAPNTARTELVALISAFLGGDPTAIHPHADPDPGV